MKNHPVLSLLVFTAFLVAGYTISIRFYPDGSSFLSKASEKLSAEPQNTIPTLGNGQRSFLLIHTSALTSELPQLQSVWLATYLPPSTTIQLLPIFPSGKTELSSLEMQLDQSFDLSKQDDKLALAQGFLSTLKENNYWWSGYIIYDDTALVEAVKLLGGIELNGEKVVDITGLMEMPNVLKDPRSAYSAQTVLLQSMCDQLSTSNTQPDFLQVFAQASSHILMDLDASQLQVEWGGLYSNHHQPSCSLPALEISRVVP